MVNNDARPTEINCCTVVLFIKVFPDNPYTPSCRFLTKIHLKEMQKTEDAEENIKNKRKILSNSF